MRCCWRPSRRLTWLTRGCPGSTTPGPEPVFCCAVAEPANINPPTARTTSELPNLLIMQIETLSRQSSCDLKEARGYEGSTPLSAAVDQAGESRSQRKTWSPSMLSAISEDSRPRLSELGRTGDPQLRAHRNIRRQRNQWRLRLRSATGAGLLKILRQSAVCLLR